ncbi:MerR family DNA-binding protein [Francisella noatunensis]|nr:MerR family DNA-binding protein [Francisella noatunensis]
MNPLRDSQSGYRLYMTQDLIKLQQIKSLSHLGLSLSRIKSILDNMTSNDWLKLINEQINYIQKQKSSLDLILLQLNNLKNTITNSDMDKKSINNILFSTLEAITMYDKYFDKDTINSFHNHNHIDQNGKVITIEESWRNWCQSLNDLMKNNIC